MTKQNQVFISMNNSKLGDKIPSLNLNVEHSCRSDVNCKNKKECYALKGKMVMHQNGVYLDNYNLFVEDKEKFFNDIIEWLNNDDVTYKFFRWFGCGDIVNYSFLLGMIRVAESCPQTRFLAFTKKHALVNMYLSLGHQIPSNLKFVFSGWDKDFKIDNPYNLPVANVEFKDTSRNAEFTGYEIPCTGSCIRCKSCWSLKEGQAVAFKKH